MNMTNSTETKRGRGRPCSFPGQETKMAGFNLPVATLELLTAAVEKRNTNRKEGQGRTNCNLVVDRALRAYLRDRKS